MQLSEVISKLNWFYTLELNQVQVYSQQSKQVNDIYIQKILGRVAEIEQGHVDNISEKILELGGKPNFMGETIAPLTGKVTGFVTGNAGIVPLLKANIALEQKAMKDYKDFLLRVGGNLDLFNLLWSNLIDEDLHTAWFQNKVQELEE